MSTVVLAYTGSLATTCAIHWLRNTKNMKVITFSADVGQGIELDSICELSMNAGAYASHVMDLKEAFAESFLMPALKARAQYENGYWLGSALTRPLLARELATLATREGAQKIAHCSTSKGNDQVRFETTVATVAPHLQIIAPMREWKMNTRQQLWEYADRYDITALGERERQYGREVCLWGTAVRVDMTNDPWEKLDPSLFQWTKSNKDTPAEPLMFEITFEEGRPVALNGERMGVVKIIQTLNTWGGEHGVGRTDTIENRLTGMKTREIYEAPAATILHKAHQALEDVVLSKHLLHFKRSLSDRYGELVYEGLWYSELRFALDAFFQSFQRYVTGELRVKLHHTSCHVVARRSPYSQYDLKFKDERFLNPLQSHSADGFMAIHKLPSMAEAFIRNKFRMDHDQPSL